MSILIRHATPADLPAVRDVYNDAVANTTAVWSEDAVDLTEREEWLRDKRAANLPVLAGDFAGSVAGFASFGAFRPWPGYRRTVEHSIYVAREHRRAGVGRALLSALIEEARTRRMHAMVAGVEAHNAASVSLHARSGFLAAGTLPEVGQKFGRSLDLTFLVRLIGPVGSDATSAGQSSRPDFVVRQDDLSCDASLALLELHLRGMHESSPPGSVFALDLTGLRHPDVNVWSVWVGERIAAIGALRMLDDGSGELKSMRTHPDFLRQGAGAALLDFIVGEASRRGMRRVSLETGSGDAFEPALSLYHRRGFSAGGPFGDYVQSDFNRFLHLVIPGPQYSRGTT